MPMLTIGPQAARSIALWSLPVWISACAGLSCAGTRNFPLGTDAASGDSALVDKGGSRDQPAGPDQGKGLDKGKISDKGKSPDKGIPLDQALAPDKTCVPKCSGLACGAANGCGGTCSTGACPSGQTCQGGKCVCTASTCPAGCCDASQVCQAGTSDSACGSIGAACQSCTALSQSCVKAACKDCSRWVLPVAGMVRDVAVDSGGNIFAVSNSGSLAGGSTLTLVAVDSCGSLVLSKSFLPPGTTSVHGTSLVIGGSALYVGGAVKSASASDPGDGMMASFSPITLANNWWVAPLTSAGADEVWDLAFSGGSLLLSGTLNTGTSSRTLIAGKASTSQAACTWSMFPSSTLAYARGIHAPAGSPWTYVAGSDGNKGLVARFDASSASVSPCKSAATNWSTTFQEGSGFTEARDLVLLGGDLYATGVYSVSSTDLGAAVFRIDLTTGQVTSKYIWNPTTDQEFLLSIATDGTDLYAAGTRGYSSGPPVKAQAAVLKLSSGSLGLQWERNPPDLGAYWSVVSLPGGDLILAGESVGSTGLIRKCKSGGICP